MLRISPALSLVSNATGRYFDHQGRIGLTIQSPKKIPFMPCHAETIYIDSLRDIDATSFLLKKSFFYKGVRTDTGKHSQTF
jgi:hypothetical protein